MIWRTSPPSEPTRNTSYGWGLSILLCTGSVVKATVLPSGEGATSPIDSGLWAIVSAPGGSDGRLLFLILLLRLAAFLLLRFFRRRNGEGAFYRLRHIYLQQHVAPVLLAPADHVLPLRFLLLFLLGRERSGHGEVKAGAIRRPRERMHLELFCVERQGLAAGHRNDPNAAGLFRGAVAGSPSSSVSSPGSGRSLSKAIHLPSGLHCGFSSLPPWVSGRSPVPAVQYHRSCRYSLCFQSETSVAMTAAFPSGERRASLMSVVFRYSSSVIRGFAGCAWEMEQARQAESPMIFHRGCKPI